MSRELMRLRAMVDEDGYNERAHYLLAGEYLGLEKWMQAAAEYRRTVELNPDYAPAWKAMGDAYVKAGRLKEAAAAYQTAIGVASRFEDKPIADEARELLAAIPRDVM